MADSSVAPSSAPRSRVVRSLARAAERPCARPGCPAPARATLTFSYATAEVHLDRLVDEVDPQGYDLCSRHAARTEAPRGWGLTDRRPHEDRVVDEPVAAAPRDLGSQATVAVLAAALRAVPEPAAAPSPTTASDGVVPSPAVGAPQVDDAPRRSVVETLLSTPDATPAEVAPRRRDTREELTLELPRVEAPQPVPPAPRPVPAAGARGPATDW